ncbi:hypothetical protein [Thalassospira sp.]|uniref:hypothetical protein n=1 Tax=Thalassospira sp. TaxID=1912094 RepID=UPI0027334895|nr:hypothetical protein [Thalassospira sp.]MDP2699293.1 hypothetical protein [Thalassospira sp.]
MNAFADQMSWHIYGSQPLAENRHINWESVGDALLHFPELVAQVVSGSNSSCYSIIDRHTALPVTLQDIERTGTMSEKLDTLLSEFSALEENWDGYDAKPINHFAINQTREFLSQLKNSIPEPSLAPDADGSVSIIWDCPHIYLDVGFDTNGRYSFYGDHEELGEFEIEPTIGAILSDQSLNKYLDKLAV